MQTASRPDIEVRSARAPAWASWLLAALAASGCSEEEKTAPSVSEPPALHVIHPQPRKIVRVVGQPSFVQSYERTSIYPKLTAFIEKWNVDIGDKVQKGDVLADLFVPELREDFGTKKATVAATTRSESGSPRRRWKSPPPRSRRPGRASTRPGRSWASTRPRSNAGTSRSSGSRARSSGPWSTPRSSWSRPISGSRTSPRGTPPRRRSSRAEAELLADEAKLARAEVNVAVARRRPGASPRARRSGSRRGWATSSCSRPYDGIVVARNANTWDFVLPTTGDPTAMNRAPDLSPSGQAAPIYVVDRTDIVRIYVDIPERDANYVHIGSEARVKIWAYRDEWLPAAVTRLSWALNTKSRTMRAEIDLPNPGSQILPGMYAYGEVIVERPNVRALPKSALTHAGGKSFIWRYEDGHAVRTEIQTGTRRRRVDRGHQSPRQAEVQPARNMGTDRDLGTGAHGQQAVHAHRRRPGAAGRSPASAEGGELREDRRRARREPDRTTGTCNGERRSRGTRVAPRSGRLDCGGTTLWNRKTSRNTTSNRGPIRPGTRSRDRNDRAGGPSGHRDRRPAHQRGTGVPVRLGESSRSDHGRPDEPDPRAERGVQSELRHGPRRIRPTAAGPLRRRGQGGENERRRARRARQGQEGATRRPVPIGGPERDQDVAPAKDGTASRPVALAHAHPAVRGRRGPGLRRRRRLGLLVLLRLGQVGRSEVLEQGLRIEQGLRLEQGLGSSGVRLEQGLRARARTPTRGRTRLRTTRTRAASSSRRRRPGWPR